MSTIHPNLHLIHASTAGAYREREILQLLQDGLPNGFDVYHGVELSTTYEQRHIPLEMDVVVLSPVGHMVILEVKAGDVTVNSSGIFKRYGGSSKDVIAQARRQHAAMLSRLKEVSLSEVRVAALLVFCDQCVTNGTAAYPRDRIVDATELVKLCSRVTAILSNEQLPAQTRKRTQAFLENHFELQPALENQIDDLNRTTVRLSDGLATWIPRLTHENGVYQIKATAGSGKTQLALSLLRQSITDHQNAAYVCFNRPLADHIRSLAPSMAEVSTFHQLCVESLQRSDSTVDFAQAHPAQIFQEAQEHYISISQSDKAKPARLDLLIVDEAQDLEVDWIEAMVSQLKPNGRLYLMSDPNQEIYGHEPFELPHAVQVQCMDNFRSPQAIVSVINQLGLTEQRVIAKSPYVGDAPIFLQYTEKDNNCSKVTAQAVQTLLDEGYKLNQIVVLSFKGREKSKLLAQAHIGKWSLKKHTGTYDAAGNAKWSDGELFIDTIHRFKGQSAPTVVLTEIECDVDNPSARDKRKLFVGLTRSQMRLIAIVATPNHARPH